MEINTVVKDNTLHVAVAGRLDTVTAPELETELSKQLDQMEGIEFDFSDLQYISSAGLRVLLSTYKKVKEGNMVIRNVREELMEIFDITGFSEILHIEEKKQDENA